MRYDSLPLASGSIGSIIDEPISAVGLLALCQSNYAKRLGIPRTLREISSFEAQSIRCFVSWCSLAVNSSEKWIPVAVDSVDPQVSTVARTSMVAPGSKRRWCNYVVAWVWASAAFKKFVVDIGQLRHSFKVLEKGDLWRIGCTTSGIQFWNKLLVVNSLVLSNSALDIVTKLSWFTHVAGGYRRQREGSTTNSGRIRRWLAYRLTWPWSTHDRIEGTWKTELLHIKTSK